MKPKISHRIPSTACNAIIRLNEKQGYAAELLDCPRCGRGIWGEGENGRTYTEFQKYRCESCRDLFFFVAHARGIGQNDRFGQLASQH